MSWGGTVIIKNKSRTLVDPKYQLWTDIIKPVTRKDLVGNSSSISYINDWFIERQCEKRKMNECLFIKGSSGTGKSSTVRVISGINGFTCVYTYADIQRTPQCMESLFREVSIFGDSGVLVLDDAESFLKETSIMRHLVKMFKRDASITGNRVIVVVICNEVDSSFSSLQDVSSVVEFNPLVSQDIYKLFRRVSSKVSGFCYIPPMDAYMIASSCTGNATQAINQLQLLYQGTIEYKKKNGKRKRKLCRVDRRDDSLKMWVSTYKNSSVDCFVKDQDLMESMVNMNRYFLDNLGVNLHKEYLKYYHNSSMETMVSISTCIDNMSLADINRPEDHEDRLYNGENAQRWSEDDLGYVIGIHNGLRCLIGKNQGAISNKKQRRRVKFSYN